MIDDDLLLANARVRFGSASAPSAHGGQNVASFGAMVFKIDIVVMNVHVLWHPRRGRKEPPRGLEFPQGRILIAVRTCQLCATSGTISASTSSCKVFGHRTPGRSGPRRPA